MNSHRDAQRIVLRFGDRTPCCSALPKVLDGPHVLCRLCGTIYCNVSVIVRAAFPGSLDVTGLTPRRLLKGGAGGVVS